MLYTNHKASCLPIVGGPDGRTVISMIGPLSRLAMNSGERMPPGPPGAGIR